MIFTGKFFVTKTTRIFNNFMLRLNMFLEMTFSGKLFITLITRILDTFMLGLNMPLKTPLCCSFLITLIARIFDLMFRLNMSLKTTHSCSLIIKQITRILDTFMKMCFKITLLCKLLSTNDLHGQIHHVFSEVLCLLLDDNIYHKETWLLDRLNVFLHTT